MRKKKNEKLNWGLWNVEEKEWKIWLRIVKWGRKEKKKDLSDHRELEKKKRKRMKTLIEDRRIKINRKNENS